MKKKLILLLAPLMLLSCGGSKPEPTYTITFNCTGCKAFDENNKEVVSVTVPVVKSERTMYQKFHFNGTGVFKTPLKSSITIKKAGTEEIVGYEYANGNISVPIIGDLIITATGSSYSKDLENSSWDEIAEISATGRADEFFKVGDTKQVTLKDQSFSHTVRIIGFNHDDLADGSGKAGITFEFANLITKNNKEGFYVTNWNGIAGQDYGENFDYRQSVLNTFLNDETVGVESFINMLPDDLSKEGMIKPVNKLMGINKTKTPGKDNYKATSFDGFTYPKLFPLAFGEIHNPSGTDYDDVTPGEAGDAGIYEYYKNHAGDTDDDMAYRVKKIVDGDAGYLYWLRSPNISCNDMAWNVSLDGLIDGHQVVVELPIAPAFCI